MSNREEFIAELSKLKPNSTFLVLHKYRNAQRELADHNIVFHISYKNALEKSLALVEKMALKDDLMVLARFKVLESLRSSLDRAKTTSVEEIEDAYQRFFDEAGEYIKGIKMHRETGDLHLYGFCHLKKVIEKGIYKAVNSSDLTIAKKSILSECPVSKFRQFRILPTQVERISVQHISLLPPDST